MAGFGCRPRSSCGKKSTALRTSINPQLRTTQPSVSTSDDPTACPTPTALSPQTNAAATFGPRERAAFTWRWAKHEGQMRRLRLRAEESGWKRSWGRSSAPHTWHHGMGWQACHTGTWRSRKGEDAHGDREVSDCPPTVPLVCGKRSEMIRELSRLITLQIKLELFRVGWRDAVPRLPVWCVVRLVSGCNASRRWSLASRVRAGRFEEACGAFG